ncbi:hypothetical protein OsJ_30651 [Oryza sativa Japonica Group]|uniref:Uncharacterized protein n=1 Tax=Oryza sativa subsp. japonica TaxID=39947 RepID=B9G7F2_ORYSJ|nr:hypothetical protein OsJ_30651 [Oryza sativa Japonica Group]
MTSLPLSSLSSSSLVSALFFLFFLPHLSSLLTLTTWESQVLLQLDGWREPLGFCEEVIDKRGYVEAIPTISEILVLFTGSMRGRGPATEMYCLYLNDPSGEPSSIVASIARPAIQLIMALVVPTAWLVPCRRLVHAMPKRKKVEGR